MPTFPAFTLTSLGLDMQAQAETGLTLVFSRIALGAGVQANPVAATALADQRMTSDVQQILNMGSGSVRIRAVFSNEALAVGFGMSEVGVFALDPTTGVEKLHSYTSTATPDYMPALSAPAKVEQIFDAIIAIGAATSVTAVIDDTVMIATKRDVEDADTISVADGNLVGEAGGLVAGQIARLHTDGKTYVASAAAAPLVILGAAIEDAAVNEEVRCRRTGAANVVAAVGCVPTLGADCYLSTAGAVSHAISATIPGNSRRIGLFLADAVDAGGKVRVWLQLERKLASDRQVIFDEDVSGETSVVIDNLSSAKRYRLHVGGVQATNFDEVKLQPNGSDANCRSHSVGGVTEGQRSYLSLGEIGVGGQVSGVEATIGPRVGGVSAFHCWGMVQRYTSPTTLTEMHGISVQGGTRTDFTSLKILFANEFTGHVLLVEEPR